MPECATTLRGRWNMRVILCGGPTPSSARWATTSSAHAAAKPLDQIGRDTLPQMLALLGAATVLLTPDSGPAHMAGMVGTPVIGLYAPPIRPAADPISAGEWCVDRFPEAARRFLGREPEQLPWNVKIEKPGVMDLIEPLGRNREARSAHAGAQVRRSRRSRPLRRSCELRTAIRALGRPCT